MPVTLVKPRPAKMDEITILKQAADVLKAHDDARQAMKATEQRLKELCREYDIVMTCWGFQPHHLRNACQARGLI